MSPQPSVLTGVTGVDTVIAGRRADPLRQARASRSAGRPAGHTGSAGVPASNGGLGCRCQREHAGPKRAPGRRRGRVDAAERRWSAAGVLPSGVRPAGRPGAGRPSAGRSRDAAAGDRDTAGASDAGTKRAHRPDPALADLGGVHIIGIAGCGTSALARLLFDRGAPVGGCEPPSRAPLPGCERDGGDVVVGHSPGHLYDTGRAAMPLIVICQCPVARRVVEP